MADMATRLRTVLVRRPGLCQRGADPEVWHYGAGFDPVRADQEHAAFCALLESLGVDVRSLPDEDDGLADSIFPCDASIMTPHGAILLAPGKELRKGEPALHAIAYRDLGVPVLGAIEAPGTAEGGDCFWLPTDDGLTLCVGRGLRTNDAGIQQLAAILAPFGIGVRGYDLAVGFGGVDACLHLTSLVSALDDRLAVVYTPLLPVAFHRDLLDAGYSLVHADDSEFMATYGLNLNVLAVKPGNVVMLDNFPKTQAALLAAGVEVTTFDGGALCMPCEGGPTCLTRPVWRAA